MEQEQGKITGGFGFEHLLLSKKPLALGERAIRLAYERMMGERCDDVSAQTVVEAFRHHGFATWPPIIARQVDSYIVPELKQKVSEKDNRVAGQVAEMIISPAFRASANAAYEESDEDHEVYQA